MYDIPPPQVQMEYVTPVAEFGYAPKQRLQTGRLVISIDNASYDPEKELAHIEMSEAFDKSSLIRGYNGDTIMLTYQDRQADYKNCPHVQVPISDVDRDLNFMDDTVTIHISNIPADIADKIRENLCLSVNADTVKAVSAVVFPPPDINTDPYDHLNP